MALNVPESEIQRIYRSRKEWTFLTFSEAIRRKTGKPCSRSEGFKLLLRLRAQAAPRAVAPARTNDAWMEKLTKSVARAGAAVKRKANDQRSRPEAGD